MCQRWQLKPKERNKKAYLAALLNFSENPQLWHLYASQSVVLLIIVSLHSVTRKRNISRTMHKGPRMPKSVAFDARGECAESEAPGTGGKVTRHSRSTIRRNKMFPESGNRLQQISVDTRNDAARDSQVKSFYEFVSTCFSQYVKCSLNSCHTRPRPSLNITHGWPPKLKCRVPWRQIPALPYPLMKKYNLLNPQGLYPFPHIHHYHPLRFILCLL